MQLKFTVLFSLIAITNFVAETEAWVAIGNYTDKAHPGKCAVSPTVILSPGETTKHPTQCAEITCNNAEGAASIYGCGAVGVPEGCQWGDFINIHAPYPQCCPRHLICSDDVDKKIVKAYQQRTIDMFNKKN